MSEQSTVSSESILCVISCEKSHQRDSEDTFSFSPSSAPLPSPIVYCQPPHRWAFPHVTASSPPAVIGSLQGFLDGELRGRESGLRGGESFFGVGLGEQLMELSWSLRESPPGARWEDTSVTEWLGRQCKSAVTPEGSVTRGRGSPSIPFAESSPIKAGRRDGKSSFLGNRGVLPQKAWARKMETCLSWQWLLLPCWAATLVASRCFWNRTPCCSRPLCGCPVFMSSFHDVCGPGGKEGDGWLEVSHHVNLARQLQFTVQSSCRTCRGGHPALPSREHMFILRTSRGKECWWKWAPASNSSDGADGSVLPSTLSSPTCVFWPLS